MTEITETKSIADHVWPHAGAECLITADVQDFFPSTSAGRVEDWWRERVDDNSARLLTLLLIAAGTGLEVGAAGVMRAELGDGRAAGRTGAIGSLSSSAILRGPLRIGTSSP